MKLSADDVRAVRSALATARKRGLLSTPAQRLARMLAVFFDLDYDRDLHADSKAELLALARAVISCVTDGVDECEAPHA